MLGVKERDFMGIEPVMRVIGILFPYGDKFKSVQTKGKRIYPELYSKFIEVSGYTTIRLYWENFIKSKKSVPFCVLYNSLKPFGAV
jgi:hypothetical protein